MSDRREPDFALELELGACTHRRIVGWHVAADHPEAGTPLALWACAECQRRFEPTDVGMREVLIEAKDRIEHFYGGVNNIDRDLLLKIDKALARQPLARDGHLR